MKPKSDLHKCIKRIFEPQTKIWSACQIFGKLNNLISNETMIAQPCKGHKLTVLIQNVKNECPSRRVINTLQVPEGQDITAESPDLNNHKRRSYD